MPCRQKQAWGSGGRPGSTLYRARDVTPRRLCVRLRAVELPGALVVYRAAADWMLELGQARDGRPLGRLAFPLEQLRHAASTGHHVTEARGKRQEVGGRRRSLVQAGAGWCRQLQRAKKPGRMSISASTEGSVVTCFNTTVGLPSCSTQARRRPVVKACNVPIEEMTPG